MPLSRTTTMARNLAFDSCTRMCPPALVYFAALLSRLANTCVSLTASPTSDDRLLRKIDREFMPRRIRTPVGWFRRPNGRRSEIERLALDFDQCRG